ncbi:MAG: four helix bundle protein [Crocinitomicaceae bacterium]
MHNFRELNIWKKAMDLANQILKCSKDFPNEYKFSLTSQISRSAISIPSNIAEGSSRRTNKDFARFLDIAQGSAYELETQLLLSESIDLMEQDKMQLLLKDLNDLQKMIYGSKKTLNKNRKNYLI